MVNEERAKRGNGPLRVVVLSLIAGEKDQKMGSTQIRQVYSEKNERVHWAEMQTGFCALMSQIGVSGEQLWWEMAALFNAPDRHYHTLTHVQHLLSLAQTLHFQEPLVIALAIWFHDVIYLPKASAGFNEVQSIHYF